jgi:hypothetical protein
MDMNEPVVAGTGMSTREDSDASVETPADSLHAASDDDGIVPPGSVEHC